MATFATSIGIWAQKEKKSFLLGTECWQKKQVGNFLSDFGSKDEAKVSLKG